MPGSRTALLVGILLALIYAATAGHILFAMIPGQESVDGMQQLGQELASRQHSVLVSGLLAHVPINIYAMSCARSDQTRVPSLAASLSVSMVS